MTADLEPPNVDQPLAADRRAELLITVIRADGVLQYVRQYVDVAIGAWPDNLVALFSRSPIAGEAPPNVLRRWWLLFRDDVDLVHELRNRVVHQIPVSDPELIKVSWLARRLIDITDPDTLLE